MICFSTFGEILVLFCIHHLAERTVSRTLQQIPEGVDELFSLFNNNNNKTVSCLIVLFFLKDTCLLVFRLLLLPISIDEPRCIFFLLCLSVCLPA